MAQYPVDAFSESFNPDFSILIFPEKKVFCILAAEGGPLPGSFFYQFFNVTNCWIKHFESGLLLCYKVDSFLAQNQILWTCKMCVLPSGCNLRILFKLSFQSTVIWYWGGIGSLSTKGCQNPNCFLSSCNRWIMLQPTVHFSFCSKGFSANAGSIPYPCVHLRAQWFPSDFHYLSWEDQLYNWNQKSSQSNCKWQSVKYNNFSLGTYVPLWEKKVVFFSPWFQDSHFPRANRDMHMC